VRTRGNLSGRPPSTRCEYGLALDRSAPLWYAVSTMRDPLNKKVICADGFTMSVQANENAYCEPRRCNEETYTLVEVGFPSVEEALLMPWAEDRRRPTDTVYGYVPVDIITTVIVKHGGMVEGQVPPGVIPIRENK